MNTIEALTIVRSLLRWSIDDSESLSVELENGVVISARAEDRERMEFSALIMPGGSREFSFDTLQDLLYRNYQRRFAMRESVTMERGGRGILMCRSVAVALEHASSLKAELVSFFATVDAYAKTLGLESAQSMKSSPH